MFVIEFPWPVLALIIVIYLTWRHLMSIGIFICSSSSLTRRLSVNAGMKAYSLYQFVRSLALVQVSWKTGITTRYPVVKFIVGHGGGGRTCGSLTVHSEEETLLNSSVPFTD